MARYRARIVEIEAVKYRHKSEETTEYAAWLIDAIHDNTIEFDHESGLPMINTLEGVMTVSDGDYIIKGLAGELYPCKPQIFELKYEPV